MEENNLKKMLELLNNALNKIEYKSDEELINETCNKIKSILFNENYINNYDLEYIDHNIKYLEEKYDFIFDLTYYFDPIFISMKKIIHKKEIDELRKLNRDKKEKKNE